MRIICAKVCGKKELKLSFLQNGTVKFISPTTRKPYKWRHLIENYFSKIKEFRGVNTRYDKTDTSYEATWCIAATIIALR